MQSGMIEMQVGNCLAGSQSKYQTICIYPNWFPIVNDFFSLYSIITVCVYAHFAVILKRSEKGLETSWPYSFSG